jgi:predicted lipoprotein with Yx(FWY)xxD motif
MKNLLCLGVLAVGVLASGCGAGRDAERVAADNHGVPTPPSPMDTGPTPTGSPMDTGPSPTDMRSPAPWNMVTKAKVSVADSSIGKILVGEKGRTLYLFEKDRDGKSACSGACAQAWPPYITEQPPEAGEGVRADLLGTTRRDDGSLQVTYNKHPLYFYVQDKKAGDTLGHDVEGFGAEWYAVTPEGKKAR